MITDEMVGRAIAALEAYLAEHEPGEVTRFEDLDDDGKVHVRASMRATLLAALGDQFVVVPREPTEAMSKAYLRACDESGACLWRTAYRVLIDAAALPSDGGGEK